MCLESLPKDGLAGHSVVLIAITQGRLGYIYWHCGYGHESFIEEARSYWGGRRRGLQIGQDRPPHESARRVGNDLSEHTYISPCVGDQHPAFTSSWRSVWYCHWFWCSDCHSECNCRGQSCKPPPPSFHSFSISLFSSPSRIAHAWLANLTSHICLSKDWCRVLACKGFIGTHWLKCVTVRPIWTSFC